MINDLAFPARKFPLLWTEGQSDLIYSVPQNIADQSKCYHLATGDVILSGTPAGVGIVALDDVVTGEIIGLASIEMTVGKKE